MIKVTLPDEPDKKIVAIKMLLEAAIIGLEELSQEITEEPREVKEEMRGNMPPTYETYRGINIYLLEDVDTGKKSIQFDWYGRMQTAMEEEYETPTFENKLQAARSAIDLCLTLKEQGHVDENGCLK